jgi:KaiC/GvpD/RAD55 family RecA-like ATPase
MGIVASQPITQTRTVQPQPPIISTGYADLDEAMKGGIPTGYAVVLVSPSYDERDLLIRKTIESSTRSGMPTFYLSNDISKIRDLTNRFKENFYALSSMADRAGLTEGNVFKIPDVGDLSGLNISSNQIIESKLKGEKEKLIVIDFLSDLLLRNKSLTTRKWLTDFIARRKLGGFTLLTTLDPTIAPQEDIQKITGVFDGVIELYEKPLQERVRRFLVIKKLYDRDYSENDLLLDKQKLL